jgi:hypothetical protein
MFVCLVKRNPGFTHVESLNDYGAPATYMVNRLIRLK